MRSQRAIQTAAKPMNTRDAVNNAIDKSAGCVPTTWLDSMLTGDKAIIGEQPYTYEDIQNLLNRIRENIISLKR